MSGPGVMDVRLGVDFGFGIDTKTDPKLVIKSKLLRMENARINKIGAVERRFGTQSLPSVDTAGNQIALGRALGVLDNELLELTETQLLSFSEATGSNFVSKGSMTPVGIDQRIVQSNLANLQSVNAASVNGVTLYAYDSIAGFSVNWMVVDETSGTVYQSGSQAGAQTPQIVVANGKLILIIGTAVGAVVARAFSSTAPWQTPAIFSLAGITLSGTLVFGAATDGTSTIMVSATNNAGGITTATYNATTMALVASANTSPGFGPPFISVTHIPISQPAEGNCSWGIYYPDLVGNLFVRFYSNDLATTFGYTPIGGSAAQPFGPGCMRQSPTNPSIIIVYATRYNPQGNGQSTLQSYCGQSVLSFGISPPTGTQTVLFPGNIFARGCQLASFPWSTGIGSGANILVQYQVDPTVAGQFPNGATPLSTQPTAFILDADTAQIVGRGPTGKAMVASQSLSGSGSYQILPNASPIDPPGNVYLIPETAATVVHVNATDLNSGTAKRGPVWTKSGTIPYNPATLSPPSVGPFGAPPYHDTNEFTLPASTPFAFGLGQSFCVTIVVQPGALQQGPIFLSNYQKGDPNGFNIQAFTNGPNPPGVGFALGPTAFIEDDSNFPTNVPIVISVGYDDPTQKMFLKVNDRPVVTGPLGAHNPAPTTGSQLGNFLELSPPNDPLAGQFFELWASTDSPSEVFFTSIYESIISSPAIQKRFLVGMGASLVLESQGGQFVYGQGVGELLLDYGQSRPVFRDQLARNALFTGGMLQRYDGQSIAELGFGLKPEFIQVQGNGSSLIDIEFTPPTVTDPVTVTTLTFPPGSQMYPGEWWAIDTNGAVLGGSGTLSAFPTKYFWYRINGQGTDPAPLPSGGTVVDILSTDSSLQVAQKTILTLGTPPIYGQAVIKQNGVASLQLQISTPYPVGGLGLSLIQSVQSGKFRVFETVPAVNGGVSTSSRCYSITCCPAAFISPGQYWQFNLGAGSGVLGSVSCIPYVWYRINGVGADPNVQPILNGGQGIGQARAFGIRVDLLSGDTAATVASKTYAAISGDAIAGPGLRGAAGSIPASGFSGNFIFMSLVTNSGVGTPDLAVPEIGANVSVGAGALGLPLGEGTAQTSQYEVVGIYAEVDGKGNIHRSAPSDPLVFVAPRSPLSDARVVYQFPNLRLSNKASNVILELYRSEANGTTLHKQTPSLQPVANNPSANLTQITDSLQDNRDPGDTTSPELTTNEIIYTDGGALPHDVLSPCSILHIHRGRAWTSGFADDRLRIQPSLLQPPGFGVAFSGDASHLIEMTQEGGDVVALGTLDEKLIIFKESLIYFTAGDGPDANGQNGAFLTPERINSAVGCSAPRSIVEIDKGLMFKSVKGMHLLTRDMQVIHLEAADGYNDLTITSASKRDGDEHVIFTTLEGPNLVFNYLRDAWGIDTGSGAIDSITYAPQIPGQVSGRVLYTLTSDGKVHAENPNDYTDDGVPFARLIQTAWVKPADQAQGFSIIREALWLGFWPALQFETLTIEYNYGQLPASVLTFNLTGNQGVWGSGTPWGGDTVWGGSGKDITQWSARPPINKVETMRFTLQEIAPFVSTRTTSVSHLDLVVGIKRGSMKLPSAQQIGS